MMELKVHFFLTLAAAVAVNSQTEEIRKNVVLPPCVGCKTVVGSFRKEINKSNSSLKVSEEANQNEEDENINLNKFTAIMSQICSDVDWGQNHCKVLANELEPHLKDWWLNKQNINSDLYEWLCISVNMVCCPDHHFGQDCKPCPGYPEKICSNNGKCRGAGTRKGNGSCICDNGYKGDMCDKCSDHYYESYRDDSKLLCSRCHESCQDICSQAGPKGCTACKKGWHMDTEKGCIDIDECYTVKNLCNKNQFCVNNDGSYVCLECDISCQGCTGDGPDMCKSCSYGYSLKDNMCVDERQLNRDWYVSLTRYLTYAGLCIATCIVFQKNMLLAGIIGLSVGVYISVAEYYLGSPTEHNNNVDVAKMLGLQA